MFKRKWLLAAAGATLVVALGAGVAMAQSATGNGTGSTFLDRVAQKLGIDTPKLQKAITDTRNEDVDAAVANGDLTQKQADALKQKIQNTPGFGGHGFQGPGGVRGGPKGFEPGFGFGFGMGFADAGQKFADFLGISTDQLRTELQADNATLATVAAAHGKSRDDVKSFITDAAKAKLDDAVKNGDLTQKREDAALKMLTDNLDKLLDGKLGLFFRGGLGRHNDGPKPGDDSPNTPAPQSGSGGNGTQSF
jgi:uncharacterized protein YidB (DUF937 family)